MLIITKELFNNISSYSVVNIHLFFPPGELGSLTNVYKASLVSMMAGSDFIKTSTGKESVNATFPVALVMVRAVRDYYQV